MSHFFQPFPHQWAFMSFPVPAPPLPHNKQCCSKHLCTYILTYWSFLFPIGQIPRSGIAWSNGMCIFNFNRYCQIICPKGIVNHICTRSTHFLHSHQHCMSLLLLLPANLMIDPLYLFKSYRANQAINLRCYRTKTNTVIQNV